MTAEHEVIFLQPRCCVDPSEGRQWCQDDVWPCGDCPEKAGGIAYILQRSQTHDD